MAVVTHGSFDEGPIVLALPSVYEYAAAEEVDPIFSAWDKSTGISILSSQVTDLTVSVQDIVDNTAVDLTGYATEQYVVDAVGVLDASLTADVASAYVPYTGATTNVNVGTNTLTAERAYVNQETPIASTELASKGYVDALAFTGAGGITPTVAHNDTTDKEGGGGGHWYHLSGASQAIISPIVDQTAIFVPSGLYVITKGISVVAGHQAAYIELGWVANTETNFDHYIVYYKKTGNEVWAEILVSTNQILIEGLTPSTDYDFAVAAVNKSGNITDLSIILVVSMDADSEAPANVVGVVALGLIQAVLLTWTHNTDVDLVAYHIYRNTINNSGTAVDIATYSGNKFVDNGLVKDTTYYYWLKAIDLSGNLSPAFSTVVSATTRNVIASDVENIAASQVIIQGVTTFASLITPATSTIDGNKITTGSITLSQLNFTPIEGSSIVATLNASDEGLEIEARLFKVSGTSIFAAGVPDTSLSRVYIYPNSTQGIKVTDNVGGNVFVVEIGGANVGDVTIGKYAQGQGILFDKSAGGGVGALYVKGGIYATSGSISGIFDFGTLAVSYTGQSENMAIIGADIYENTANAHGSAIRINRIGYQGGVTRYRNTIIYDGEGNQVLTINGAASSATVYGELKLTTTTGSLIVPSMTTTQRQALLKAAGSIVYDTTQRRFCGVIMNNAGGLEWWTFGMNTNLG